MKKKENGPGRQPRPNEKPLRRKAELFLDKQAVRIPEGIELLSSEEIKQTLHELQVHQIELEMQNEELRRVQAALEESRARYFDIYDLAPVGYCTVSAKGLILEANLTTGLLLGVARSALRGVPFSQFVFKEDQDVYYLYRKKLVETREPQKAELRMLRLGGTPVWVLLSATTAYDSDRSLVCRIVLSDISERKQTQAALATILTNVPDVIARFDQNLRYLFINDTGLREFNLAEEHILGKTSRELGMPENVVDAWEKTLHSVFLNQQVQDLSMEYETRQGRKFYHSLIAPEYNEEGSVSTVISITREVTRQKMMEQQLYVEKEQFRATLLSVGEGVISTDSFGHVVVMNKIAERLTGWSDDEAIGKPLHEVFCAIDEVSRRRCEHPLSKAQRTDDCHGLINQAILISKDGFQRPIEEQTSPIVDFRNEVSGVVVVFRDCTERRRYEEEMEDLSFRDALTGLYNRRFFDEGLARLDVEENLPLSLVMLDVNGLKLTNDAFGHSVGDELLKKVADVLRYKCRSEDVIARIGGDELAITLPMTDVEQADRLMQRIRDAFALEKVAAVPLSVACGWATKRNRHEDINEIFKVAEELMYRDKGFGRSKYHHQAIQLIRETIQKRVPAEQRHSNRVGELCGSIGLAMGFNAAEKNELITAGIIHDIGKICINGETLEKTSDLSCSEWFGVKRHPEVGYSILSSSNEYAGIAEYVLAHHERWDGTGYPHGLKGNAIPLPARIIAIADAYDAMTTERPFRKRMSDVRALNEIRACAGSQFDPTMAEVFVRMMQEEDVGT